MEKGICECIECGSLHAPGAQYGNTPELTRLAAEVEELTKIFTDQPVKLMFDKAEIRVGATGMVFMNTYNDDGSVKDAARTFTSILEAYRALKSGEVETDV